MSDPELRLRVIPAIDQVLAEAWDACANPKPAAIEPSCKPSQPNSQRIEYNPFVLHSFLGALEASGSAAARTGWQPQHLIAESADGTIVGAVPCYLKSHSRGE
jgi:predicted N-acyltransferase